jgi:hypothetical protein
MLTVLIDVLARLRPRSHFREIGLLSFPRVCFSDHAFAEAPLFQSPPTFASLDSIDSADPVVMSHEPRLVASAGVGPRPRLFRNLLGEASEVMIDLLRCEGRCRE